MKKVICFMVIVFSLFFLTSCKGEDFTLEGDFVSLSIVMTKEGTISQSIEFSVNEKKFAGAQEHEVAKFKSALRENIDELRTEFLLTFALIYSSSPNENFAINKGVVLSDVAIENDIARFSIIFPSFKAWQYYHPSGDGGNAETQTAPSIKNMFVTKNQSNGAFPFSQMIGNGKTLADKYKEKYTSALAGLSFETKTKNLYKPKFVYDYATTSSRLHSNSDFKAGANGIYHNIWVSSDDEEKDVCLYSYSINYSNWYLWAILLTTIPCAIKVALTLRKEKLGR